MYEVRSTSKFRKDYKRCARQGKDMRRLEAVVFTLEQTGTLPPEYKDHALTGDRAGQRECHIAPDWLLVYAIDHGVLVLALTETGSHSDLFG